MNFNKDDGMLAQITKRADDCIWLVMRLKLRRATAYISPRLTVKASAQRRQDNRDSSTTVLVTIGAPNYPERQFIRACQKAGEEFPVKKTQLKYWPKK